MYFGFFLKRLQYTARHESDVAIKCLYTLLYIEDLLNGPCVRSYVFDDILRVWKLARHTRVFDEFTLFHFLDYLF